MTLPVERDRRRAIGAALRLADASARLDSWSPDEWRAVFDAAREERLAALAWHHGQRAIIAAAPGGVVTRWREIATATRLMATIQLEHLVEVQRAAREGGLTVLAYKGFGLAQLAHGVWWARPAADIDIWVPARDRAAVGEMLAARGWVRTRGAAPGEESFEREGPLGTLHLEVQTRLVHRALAHRPMADPEAVMVDVGGVTVDVAAGPIVPALLAEHLSKHWFPPLLWVNDIRALWRSMSELARGRARAAAAAAGLDGFLEWALARCAGLDAVVAGNDGALGALGYRIEGRRGTHPLVRALALSPSVVDAARVATAWLLPPEMRAPRVLAARTARRMARLTSYLLARQRYGAIPAAPSGIEARSSLPVDSRELLDLIAPALDSGAGAWVRASGVSMWPTIPSGAEVRIEPAADDVRPGDVVLAQGEGGAVLLHRVRRKRGEALELIGDACERADGWLARAQVVGVARRVRHAGREWALGHGALVLGRCEVRRSLLAIRRRLRHRLAMTSQ